MPKITILPHETICPQGMQLELPAGALLLEELLKHGVHIEHACELSCACTTCHVVVTKGFSSLAFASDSEEDLLDKAWGVEMRSRLGCQIKVGDRDLEIEIPKYTINQVSERH